MASDEIVGFTKNPVHPTVIASKSRVTDASANRTLRVLLTISDSKPFREAFLDSEIVAEPIPARHPTYPKYQHVSSCPARRSACPKEACSNFRCPPPVREQGRNSR